MSEYYDRPAMPSVSGMFRFVTGCTQASAALNALTATRIPQYDIRASRHEPPAYSQPDFFSFSHKIKSTSSISPSAIG